MTTTISVNEETSRIFRLLSQRTKIDLIDIMDELGKQIKIMLEDGIEESSRISFMARADLATSQVKLYFAPILTSLSQLPPEAIKYYRKLKAAEDAELCGKAELAKKLRQELEAKNYD